MRILYFDTETNGLPKGRDAPDTDINAHPEPVEIAWQIWEDGKLIKRCSYLLKPDPSIEWNMESANIHKIYKPIAMSYGTPMDEVFTEFKEDCSTCDAMVAHNIAFDIPVVKCAFIRLWPTMDFSWLPKSQICTMKLMTNECKLPFANSKYPQKPGKYKPPRLVELHKYLFGDEGDFDLHTAGGDVDMLVKCAIEMINRNILVI